MEVVDKRLHRDDATKGSMVSLAVALVGQVFAGSVSVYYGASAA